ncbi:hypothetical protein SDJN02_02621 [Cucurbita argyrosperma subsp. argyrosperma]|uniref:uncharacterized protein LOC111795861 n=1 Tax=Cucurbita pepo subsp. pepo TaxID=3664 RepID=UPI000C9D7CE8|nr:uncharacterized protein LOC111795861 [Cucurbita pepo subsp. pepo]KAG7035822.1 hypothetical protein SDJN02_02621 [Cucurbita argyrosperma subsp. argyrosperma]
MAPTPKSHLGVVFFTFIAFLASIPELAVAGSDAPTVYDILPQYGLPSGLLPDSVVDYSLSSDGQFVVHLAKPCYINFDYLVYYDKTITGKLKYGSITDLDGIEVRKFLMWLDVKEIRVDLPPSDNIYFQVGFINKKLDIDQFKTVHSCRDDGLGYCLDSWKRILELPTPVDDVPMLVTE